MAGKGRLAARLAAVDRLARDGTLARRSAQLDAAPEFPRAEFRALAEAGLLGLRLPLHQGGQGLSMADAGRVLHRLAYEGGTTFAKLSVPPEFCSVLVEHGSPALRAEAWAPLLRGERLIANHITEPDAGSDAGALAARADRVAGGYVLSGVKSEAAFACDADAAIVYAKVGTAPPNGGITAFLVPQDHARIRREVVPDLGERWMRRGTVTYDRVPVPEDHRIGDEGRAFDYLKDELVRERALLAMIYLGVGRASWEEVVRHVGERRAFGRPLSDQQGVAFPLAADAAHLRSAELFAEETLRALDAGEPGTSGAAALSKWLAVETALTAIDHAIQFHGGKGYSRALPHEQRWRDVRSGAIAHGPSEIMLRIAGRDLWPRAASPEPGRPPRTSERPTRGGAPAGSQGRSTRSRPGR
ncbi:MAG: acyl-CoA dehydrogenase family protein [Thermoplasmata archaeon]|nr:acyl-CoA dehydrogenase family protein [Thermoplasmata archaeon]